MNKDNHPPTGDPNDLTALSDTKSVPENFDALNEQLLLNHILPGLNPTEPTAMLLDCNNFFARARDANWTVDYDALKSIFENRCDLRYAAAFSAISANSYESKRWTDFMKRIGYTVHTKTLKEYKTREDEWIVKGNMDIELVIDALGLSDGFSHIIIGTNDGDFLPLIPVLKKGNLRRVSVLGMSGRNFEGIDRNLIEKADNFYDMTKFQKHVSYVPRRKSGVH